MSSRSIALVRLRLLSNSFASSSSRNPPIWNHLWRRYSTSTISETLAADEKLKGEDSVELLRRWGCTDADLSILLSKQPGLRRLQMGKLQSKLTLLTSLGLTSSDLVAAVKYVPRFLGDRDNHEFDSRLQYLRSLFRSEEKLRLALKRCPLLLTWDIDTTVKPVVSQYEKLGVTGNDLIQMLVYKPRLINLSTFSDEKLEYIRKTGASADSKSYKYIVTLLATIHIHTLREKFAAYGKFGFSEGEVLGLFGRSHRAIGLSADRIQKHLSFALETLKLPPTSVLHNPFLMTSNLELVLQPRALLARKIDDMGLSPRMEGSRMLKALSMPEIRFLKTYVKCHPKDVASELMDFYAKAKVAKD